MKMRWIVLVVLLLVSVGVLEAQRTVSENDYERALSGEAGLSVVIDQSSPVVGCGQAVTLTTSITGANGIAWLRDGEYIDGATTETFVANQPGVYTVIAVSLFCQLESAPVEVIILSPLNAQIMTPAGNTACEGDSVTLMASGAGAGSVVVWQWYRNGSSISGANQEQYQATQTGNYTLVGNEGSICASASAPVSVEILPLPAVSLTWSGIPTICGGDSLLVVANTQDNQQIAWYHDDVLVAGAFTNELMASAAGEYHAQIVQTFTGCESTTGSVYLEYFPQQTVAIVANGPTLFCAGSQVQLSVDQGSGTIEWLNNEMPVVGASEILLSVFESGSFMASITDANGCREYSNSVDVVVESLPDGALLVENNWPVLCGQDTLIITAADGNAYVWMMGDSVLAGEELSELQVTMLGSYSVELTNAAGCVNYSQSVEVLQFELPLVVMEPAGNLNICAGQTQLLDVQASSALSYTWLLNGAEFTTDFINALEVAQAGEWTVLVYDENGCAVISDALILSVLDVATPVITAEVVTSEGQLLLSDDASGHQWFLNGETIEGATGSEYLATVDGVYSVISIEDVCESEVSEGYTVVLGSVASRLSAGIAIYPNPGSDFIRVNFGQGVGSNYRIYDASGNLVYSGVITLMQIMVDVQSWSAGMYSLVTEQGVRVAFTVVR